MTTRNGRGSFSTRKVSERSRIAKAPRFTQGVPLGWRKWAEFNGISVPKVSGSKSIRSVSDWCAAQNQPQTPTPVEKTWRSERKVVYSRAPLVWTPFSLHMAPHFQWVATPFFLHSQLRLSPTDRRPGVSGGGLFFSALRARWRELFLKKIKKSSRVFPANAAQGSVSLPSTIPILFLQKQWENKCLRGKTQ